jgi:Uma2 family endonuclease
MRFIEAAADFAVEVRSESDYGPAAEKAMAAKRTDYFEAGTRAVWDVDPEAKMIRLYRSSAPAAPVLFSAGMEANAEPAVPGWTISVDWIMA